MGSKAVEQTTHTRTSPRQIDVVFVARGLCKTYDHGEAAVHALRNLDLDIVAGEFVVLLGPSGSGKSTLLNILGGGVDTPTSGRASWRDHELAGANEAELTAYRRVEDRLNLPRRYTGKTGVNCVQGYICWWGSDAGVRRGDCRDALRRAVHAA